MNIPTQKQIIKTTINSKDFYILVTFVNDNFINGYTISFGQKYKNNLLNIPSKYLNRHYAEAYVNIFSGFKNVNIKYVNEIVSTIPDDIWNNITSAIVSLMLGDFIINSNSTVRLINRQLNLTDIINMLFVNSNIKEKESPEEVRKQENLHKYDSIEIKEDTNIISTNDIYNDNIEINNSNNLNNRDLDLKDIIKHYSSISNENDRLDYIFEVWAIDNKISPYSVYRSLFEYAIYKPQKNSIRISKSEFLMILEEFPGNIVNYKFHNQDGSERNLSIGSISNLKSIIKSIYYNAGKSSRDKPYKKRSNIRDEVKELKESGKSNGEILEKYLCSPRKYYDVKRFLDILDGKEYHYSIMNRLKLLLKSDNKEITDIAKYLLRNLNRMRLFIKECPSDFVGNKDLFSFIAIMCSEFRIGTYKALIQYPNFANTKIYYDICNVLDINKYIAASTTEIIKKDKNIGVLVYSYLFSSSNKAKRLMTNNENSFKLTNLDLQFISIASISKDQFISGIKLAIENKNKYKNESLYLANSILNN